MDPIENIERAVAAAMTGKDTVSAELERLREIVEHVRELHRPNAYGVCETCLDEEPLAAGDCGGATWPCATARALEGS